LPLASPEEWLSDVVVLNESRSFSTPGDVHVFRNMEDMCGYLEHWFVEEKHGYALTGNGYPVELTTDGKRVFGTVLSDREPSADVLTDWLVHYANAVREARIHKSKKRPTLFATPTNIGLAELEGVLPQSVEGLLAYIFMK